MRPYRRLLHNLSAHPNRRKAFTTKPPHRFAPVNRGLWRPTRLLPANGRDLGHGLSATPVSHPPRASTSEQCLQSCLVARRQALQQELDLVDAAHKRRQKPVGEPE